MDVFNPIGVPVAKSLPSVQTDAAFSSSPETWKQNRMEERQFKNVRIYVSELPSTNRSKVHTLSLASRTKTEIETRRKLADSRFTRNIDLQVGSLRRDTQLSPRKPKKPRRISALGMEMPPLSSLSFPAVRKSPSRPKVRLNSDHFPEGDDFTTSSCYMTRQEARQDLPESPGTITHSNMSYYQVPLHTIPEKAESVTSEPLGYSGASSHRGGWGAKTVASEPPVHLYYIDRYGASTQNYNGSGSGSGSYDFQDIIREHFNGINGSLLFDRHIVIQAQR